MRTPHSSAPAIRFIAESIAGFFAVSSSTARSALENIVKSFIGTTVVEARRVNDSTTASCAMATRPTHSRSDRCASSAAAPYTSSGTSATTSHSMRDKGRMAGRLAPGTPGATRATDGFRAARTTQ